MTYHLVDKSACARSTTHLHVIILNRWDMFGITGFLVVPLRLYICLPYHRAGTNVYPPTYPPPPPKSQPIQCQRCASVPALIEGGHHCLWTCMNGPKNQSTNNGRTSDHGAYQIQGHRGCQSTHYRLYVSIQQKVVATTER